MPEVTINAADLEALLFAAGAANANPEAKKILKRDPQFEQVEGRLTDAIKRAGDSWRKAGRADAYPERFSVDEQEIAYLKKLAGTGATARFGMEEPLNDTVPRSYVTKMLVEYGIYSETVAWSASGDLDTMKHANRRVRLTADARHIIAGRFAHDPPAAPQPKAELAAPRKHDFGPTGTGRKCLHCFIDRYDVEDHIASGTCPTIVPAAKQIEGADNAST